MDEKEKDLKPAESDFSLEDIMKEFGDPAEEVPGENIIFPAKPSLLKARDMDLNRLRRSLIKRQAAAAGDHRVQDHIPELCAGFRKKLGQRFLDVRQMSFIV